MNKLTLILNWKDAVPYDTGINITHDILNWEKKNKPNFDIVICPDNIAIAEVATMTSDSEIYVWAQNVRVPPHSPMTGSTGYSQLSPFVSHVIVGHSERKKYGGELPEMIARKFFESFEHGITPILCVGEVREYKRIGDVKKSLEKQFEFILKYDRPITDEFFISYEPEWAIGHGNKTPEYDQIEEIASWIQEYFADKDIITKVIYGGSTNAKNAAKILSLPSVSWALIGRAGMESKKATTLLAAAQKVMKTA